MRITVYLIAVLAAAGIVYFVSESDSPEVAPPVATASTGEAKLVLHVPQMHCPFGCYPAVEKTLTKQPGVKGVELAKQADPNAIDNPRVVVTVAGDPGAFDQQAALAALTSAGFAKSSVETP